jgi:hypothetical protein
MQSILIQLPIPIKILPENSDSLSRLDFKPFNVIAVVVDTLEETGITPFGGLGSFDAGEDCCAALAFGDEVGEDGGFAVAGCAHVVVLVGIEPVVVFAEKVAAAVPAPISHARETKKKDNCRNTIIGRLGGTFGGCWYLTTWRFSMWTTGSWPCNSEARFSMQARGL